MYHTDIHSGDGIARLDRVDTSRSTMIHLLPASFIFPLRILNIEREPYRELHQGLGAAQQRGRAELSDQWRRQSYSTRTVQDDGLESQLRESALTGSICLFFFEPV